MLLDDLRRHDSVFWRRAIRAGVTYGPDAFVRYSPPLFGLAFAALLAKQRRHVRETLRLALGARGALAENVDVARVFTNYASSLAEAFVAGSDRGVKLVCKCRHDEHYIAAAAEGRGVIVATAHTGGWQHAGQMLRELHAADVIVVMRRERDQRAQALQDTVRDRSGVRLIHVGDDPLDALMLLSHLRVGGVVAVQIDRLPQGMRGREVGLFGRSWSIPEGPLKLAAISGAPIVPVFTLRRRYMEYEVHVGRAIHLRRRPSVSDLDAAGSLIAREIEAFVATNPTQWFHFE